MSKSGTGTIECRFQEQCTFPKWFQEKKSFITGFLECHHSAVQIPTQSFILFNGRQKSCVLCLTDFMGMLPVVFAESSVNY